MLSLRTEGFADLVDGIAEKARECGKAAPALHIALTLDDRLDEEIGLAALTDADRTVVERARRSDARLDGAGGSGERLFLTRTGRLVARPDGEPAPADAHPLGRLAWTGRDSVDSTDRWHREHDRNEREIRALRDELAREPDAEVARRIDRIEHAVTHMAPVLIYVNDKVYSNLGKLSNLPGKSLSVGHEQSVLTLLRRTRVAAWEPEDACFVTCLDVLLSSGPPVRAEEFNGVQLNPGTLARFLVDRVTEYGTGTESGRPGPRCLAELAAACGRLRTASVADGVLPYRVINGLNLHKREHLMAAPAVLADAPEPVASHVSRLLGADLAPDARIGDLASRCAGLAGRLIRAPAPERFSTAFEAVLHEFLTVTVEAFAADVSLSRGPRRFEPVGAEPQPESDPFDLGTGDFYCCVVPSRAFVERCGDDRRDLVRALASFSARMRFNSWHYLPDTLGVADRDPERGWFFAPTAPDVTTWSDMHHTGHVAFGVRHAIRVPFGIDYDGRPLPGLFDLRLLRTAPPAFDTDDLRRATATATILRQLWQAMSAHQPTVTDFGKDWYQRFHG